MNDNQKLLDKLRVEYDKLQKEYGAKELDSIYNGGCVNGPDICFVFMNPTGRNVASYKTWQGRKSPWIGTKNIWTLFRKCNLIEDDLYYSNRSKTPKEWDYDFADEVYNSVENNK